MNILRRFLRPNISTCASELARRGAEQRRQSWEAKRDAMTERLREEIRMRQKAHG